MTNISGQTFGEITVISVSNVVKQGAIIWRCRCRCGKDVMISESELNKSFVCNHSIKPARTEKIICLSGGFDPIHRGHLEMFRDAKAYGKVLVILNSDIWLDRKKGYHLMDWDDRAEILKSFRFVDDVVPVDDINGGTVCEALRIIKPDYFGNGGDRTQTNTPEVALCEELGIETVWELGGGKIQSSSELIDNVVNKIIDKIAKWQ